MPLSSAPLDFDLFVYGTIGRRHELEAGLAGLRNDLYQRFLGEMAELVTVADQAGYSAFGHPEHHLQVEGFEIINDPGIMSMYLGQHREQMTILTCGYVSTTHNPLRVAENIATLDHMHRGRFAVGLVRGYQARWVENFKVRENVGPVGPWNKDTEEDDRNRRYFEEYVDIVYTALNNETFSYEGEFWTFPNFERNPHPHDVYTKYGAGFDADMTVHETGIAPRPFQSPHPKIYSGFTGSARTAAFWGRYGGKSIVLGGGPELLKAIWSSYDRTAEQYGRDVVPGEQACWGGLMICAETDEAAMAQLDDVRWFFDTWALPFGQPIARLLVGSPDTITRQIEEALDIVPINEVMMLIPQGIHEPAQLNASVELFAERVLPRFR